MRRWLLGLVGALAVMAACSSSDDDASSKTSRTCDAGVCPSGSSGATSSGDIPGGEGGTTGTSSSSSGGVPPEAGSVPGTLPAGLAPKMLLGLFEDLGQPWMKNSGVPWNARYRYLVKGWENNFGYGPHDGSWARSYWEECDKLGAVPAVSYYVMNGEPGGSESSFLAKAQNVGTMTSYFGDFKLLMQQAKQFAKPVFIMLEPDGYAFLQQQAKNDPKTAAAVASTGLPELAGLPNTVEGWGLAFLAIRKAVGANNAILGMHISAWASTKDVSYVSVTDPLEPEIAKVYDFLAPLGLSPNVTGQTYDVLVGDPLDRDSDYYRLVKADPNRWWDEKESAPVASRSFNRYAEWLRLWNVKTSKRWVLWQIPVGNSNHLNVNNDGQPRQGYKDNRPEYFLGPDRSAHLEKFAKSGVIALLFGAGLGGMSSYENDTYTDGKLFMQTHAAEFFEAGGFPIAP